jgi:hypothetical protein
MTKGLSQYDKSRDTTPQARAARFAANKGPADYLRTIAGPGCWCGGELGHDWPGRDEGAPHPREVGTNG